MTRNDKFFKQLHEKHDYLSASQKNELALSATSAKRNKTKVGTRAPIEYYATLRNSE
jgi:hypothetical protein